MELIKVSEYAKRINKTRVRVYQMIKEGKLKSEKKYGIMLVYLDQEQI